MSSSHDSELLGTSTIIKLVLLVFYLLHHALLAFTYYTAVVTYYKTSYQGTTYVRTYHASGTAYYICIRMPVKFSYFCQLFVRVLFGKTLSARTHETRPDTLVEVSERPVYSGARGGRAKFFPAGMDKATSLVSVREALFCTYVSVNVVCFLP